MKASKLLSTEIRPEKDTQKLLTRKALQNTFLFIILSLTILIFLIPLYWLFISGLKSDMEITAFPPTFWPREIHWENFTDVWGKLNFARSFWNSFFVSTTTTALIIIFTLMAGYAFAKKRFIGRNFFFALILGSMIIPHTVLYLPMFVIISKIGLYDNLWGIILPFGVTVFGIFFMRQFISDIPDSLIEAARIDGCREFPILFKIIVPLCKPAIGALAIIEFVNNWNSFVVPLILMRSSENYTLAISLGLLKMENVIIPWSEIMAGNVLFVAPVIFVFVFLQKYFVRSLMSGAIKE